MDIKNEKVEGLWILPSMKCRHFISNQNRRGCKFKVAKVQAKTQAYRSYPVYFDYRHWEYCKKGEECMICYEPTSPERSKIKLDGCSHSLCYTCVLQLWNNRARQLRRIYNNEEEEEDEEILELRCPMCRAPFTDKSTFIDVEVRSEHSCMKPALMEHNSGLMLRTMFYKKKKK